MVRPEYNQKDQDEAYESSNKNIQRRNKYVTLSDYQKRQLLKFQELRKNDKSDTAKKIKDTIKDIKKILKI